MNARRRWPEPRHGVAPPNPARGLPPWRSLAYVATGGALGAVARVGLEQAMPVARDGYPWTTFAENLGGAFALALVLTLMAERVSTHPGVRLLLCTGALGAFTTFSTFSSELAGRLLDGHVALAGLYAVASLAGGMLAVVAGSRLARVGARPLRSADRRRPSQERR